MPSQFPLNRLQHRAEREACIWFSWSIYLEVKLPGWLRIFTDSSRRFYYLCHEWTLRGALSCGEQGSAWGKCKAGNNRQVSEHAVHHSLLREGQRSHRPVRVPTLTPVHHNRSLHSGGNMMQVRYFKWVHLNVFTISDTTVLSSML